MTDSSPIHLQNSIGPSICDWAEKRVTYFTSASRTRGLLFCMGRNSGQIHNHIENIMTPACRPRTDASIWLYALFTFFSFFYALFTPARPESKVCWDNTFSTGDKPSHWPQQKSLSDNLLLGRKVAASDRWRADSASSALANGRQTKKRLIHSR